MASLNTRSQVMKRNSRALITAAIRKRGTMSRVQLAKITNISRTHVSDVVDELIKDGTLVETGSVCNRPGRPRVLLQINQNGPAVAGVWLSEDAIQIGVAGPDGAILSRREIAYDTCNDSTEQAITVIADEIRRCAEQVGRNPNSLQAVGVTVSGFVDPTLGMVTRTKLGPCFIHVPIARMLGDELGIPAYIETDIRASAFNHNWHREGEDRALYVWFLDGIGAAYVTDHQLFGAAHYMAPSVGHMIMAPDGPLCQCGRHACLEAYASTYAFIRYIWPDVNSQDMTTIERRDLVRRGMDMVVEGDTTAIRALATTTEYIGQALANTVNLLDPQIVYIAGVMMDHSPEMMLEVVRREAKRNINRSLQGVEIKVLPEIDDFGLRGALGLVLLRPYRVLQEINSKMLHLSGVA